MSKKEESAPGATEPGEAERRPVAAWIPAAMFAGVLVLLVVLALLTEGP
jgi:hypothetical protein